MRCLAPTPSPYFPRLFAQKGKAEGLEYDFKLSVLEIYNERVFDLLVDPRTAADRRKRKEDLAIKVP